MTLTSQTGWSEENTENVQGLSVLGAAVVELGKSETSETLRYIDDIQCIQ